MRRISASASGPWKAPMSPPAMKARPAPHSTTQRSPASWASPATASRMAAAMAASMAFSRSGRLKRRRVTAPERSMRRGFGMPASLHRRGA
jgi:hypothetical protein